MIVPIGMPENGIALPGLMSALAADAITFVANAKTLRRKDIGLLAVFVFYEGDECGPVRVIFDAFDGCRHIHFVPFEIDDPIEALCAPPLRRIVIRPVLFRPPDFCQTLSEGFTGRPFQSSERSINQPALAWRSRLIRL